MQIRLAIMATLKGRQQCAKSLDCPTSVRIVTYVVLQQDGIVGSTLAGVNGDPGPLDALTASIVLAVWG